eukprot:30920-Pelagococcus_subviridis.AAC.40
MKKRDARVGLDRDPRREPHHRQPPVQELLPRRERPERTLALRLGRVLLALDVRHERRERDERRREREREDVVVRLRRQRLARDCLRGGAGDERDLRDAA